MNDPELSIVVAASGAERALDRCHAAIREQSAGVPAEVIVATFSTECAQRVRILYPEALVLAGEAMAHGKLVEHLWASGIAQARGRLIALTSAACIPDGRWVAEILGAHSEYYSGIGGAIELAPDASRLDWAAYLVRFARFMLPVDESSADLPAENVSYKGAALAAESGWIAANGFWVQDVNAHLRAQMRSLRLNPRCIVQLKQPYSSGDIVRQQIAQGRLLGRARARRTTGMRRLAYLAATPVIPLLRLRRIAREVSTRRRHRGQFVASLPLIALILVCEAAGELAGMADPEP
jgi:hypothetical protein